MPKNSKSIIVVVADDALPEIQQVVSRLELHGMEVKQVLPITGIITGKSEAYKITGLSKIEGVVSVETEASATLPPASLRQE
jgi:hypothetical protein